MITADICPTCNYSDTEPFSICPTCGIVISKYLARKEKEAEEIRKRDEPVRCPKCHSSQINVDKRGFGAGSALVGALLLGPIGLAAGAVGKDSITFTCVKCYHTWAPAPTRP